MLFAWLLPVVGIRLHVGDLHTVSWDECPFALVTPVKAIRFGVGYLKKFVATLTGYQGANVVVI